MQRRRRNRKLWHQTQLSNRQKIIQIHRYFLLLRLGFTVSHEVAIKVLAVDYISDLADTILKEPDTKIVSFEWKPLEEVNKEEAAVKQGTDQGMELCDELGMHYGSTLNVEEMT